MRRVIVMAVAGATLAGCSSFSLDSFKPTPPTVQVQLESVPPGAEARTSLGPSCKTPCSVAVPAPDAGFSVSYTLNKFQPATIPVQVIHVPGDFTTPASTNMDPNPVVAELQPAGPPPSPRVFGVPRAVRTAGCAHPLISADLRRLRAPHQRRSRIVRRIHRA